MISRFTYYFRLQDFFKVIYYCFFDRENTLKLYEQINEELGLKNIFFTNHARTGLKLLLRVVQKGKKLKVGVQAYNCETVFKAIITSGNTPFYLDIDENFGIDMKKLTIVKNEIDVLIVTHTFGNPVNIQEIKKIIGKKIIIEDCAHSQFSMINEKYVGTLADASIFSFGYGKYPSIGKGGYLVINNEELLADVTNQYNSLKNVGLKQELSNLFKILLFTVLHVRILYKYFTYPLKKKFGGSVDVTKKGDATEFKGLCTNTLRFILAIINDKNLIKKQFMVGEEIRKGINKELFSKSLGSETKTNCFCLPLLCNKQKDFISFLTKRGIEASAHFSNSIKIAKEYGYKNNSCPVSEKIVNQIVTIPCHYDLTNKDVDHIIKSVNSYYI